MIKFTLSNRYRDRVIEDLEAELGPRRYYIHNKIGGVNWTVSWPARRNANNEPTIEIQLPNQSESYISYLMLKYDWL